MSRILRPEQFLISPEEIASTVKNPREKSSRKPKGGIQFYQFPKAVVDALTQVNYAPAWALAAAIYKGWYEDFKKRNPVKLTSALLAEFLVSKKQKSKGLKFLEQSDPFLVERFPGRNPLVTMKWILIKD
jgi:hypothetical protein